jgi:hypothetical protein
MKFGYKKSLTIIHTMSLSCHYVAVWFVGRRPTCGSTRCLYFSRHCSLDLCQKQTSIVNGLLIRWNSDLMHKPKNGSVEELFVETVGECLFWKFPHWKLTSCLVGKKQNCHQSYESVDLGLTEDHILKLKHIQCCFSVLFTSPVRLMSLWTTEKCTTD